MGERQPNPDPSNLSKKENQVGREHRPNLNAETQENAYVVKCYVFVTQICVCGDCSSFASASDGAVVCRTKSNADDRLMPMWSREPIWETTMQDE